MTEATAEGACPAFGREGFVRPPRVELVREGRYRDCLVSPRSGVEYGVANNGANGGETPMALDMAPGGLPEAGALKALGTGVYVSNLWYCNFSDRSAGRLTGMTRFASFWVEDGELVAPLNVMRFDDTIYRMLGENLIDLTEERAYILDNSTYDGRSSESMHVPGAPRRDALHPLIRPPAPIRDHSRPAGRRLFARVGSYPRTKERRPEDRRSDEVRQGRSA